MRYIKYIFVALFLVFTTNLFAQTKGLIYEPASGAGSAILDPNGDGFTSSSIAGFISDDQNESEISFAPIIFPSLEPHSDIVSGPDCGFSDFVDSGTEDPAQQFVDASNNWIFRLRMGGTSPNAKSYSILIDTDGLFGPSGATKDPDYSSANPGFEIEVVLATKFGVYVYDVDNMNCTPVISYTGTTNYQKSIAHSAICSATNYFFDFFININDLTIASAANGSTANLFPGVNAGTEMRMAIIDNMGANKSTLCSPNSASDVGGVGNCPNLESCFTEIIDNYPPCAPGVDCPKKTPCPVISGAYSSGNTAISGTGEIGATVEVYVDGITGGVTTVVDVAGNWSLTLGSALANGEEITASQILSPNSISSIYCSPIEVLDCSGAPTAAPTVSNASGKNICGTGVVGYDIEVYGADGNFVAASPVSGVSDYIPVPADGAWVWKCTGNTGGCNAGSGVDCLDEGAYAVYQIGEDGCKSLPEFACVESGMGSPISQTPVIVASTVFAGATSIDVTVAFNVAPSPQSGYLHLFVDGEYAAKSSLISSAGTSSVTVSSLNQCATLTARFFQSAATGDHDCVSAVSASVTINDVTETPVISGSYCTATTIDSIYGTSNEPAGTTIKVYDGGSELGSTTVQSNGYWSVTSLSIASGVTVTATAELASCGSVSALSGGVLIGSKTASAVAITSSPITEGDATISGTGVTSDEVYLYMDGYYTGNSVTVAGGVWTISGLASYELYSGGEVTVTTETPGNCESDESTGVTVACVKPLTTTVVNPDDTTVCAGTVAAKVRVVSSENLIVYQLWNGGATTGSAVLGNGSTVNLTSDALSSNTTITVKAVKISGQTCENTLTDDVTVTVDAVPDPSLTVTASPNSICVNSSSIVSVALSEVGFNYQLVDKSDDSNVGSAVAGDGGGYNTVTHR